jgi:iron complex outermembrane receptor protein
MSRSITRTGRLCSMTLGLLACAAATAQEAPPVVASEAAPVAEQAAPASETAPLEQESTSAGDAPVSDAPVAREVGDDIGEVIVTARRVQERLQDVPISITVFNQDQLTERNVATATDLATYTPSLTSNARYGSDNASFAIRGFTQEQRTTASVGVYFADVVAPRAGGVVPGGDGAGPGSFFDLANVQVLKGPQGTLFGRNTTGGAVLLVPQKPTGTYEGFVENSIGSYDLSRTTGVVNVPVSDSVRMRFGVERNLRDGFLKNNSNIGPTDFGDVGYTAYRLSVVADLSENVENYTIGSFSRSNTNGMIPSLVEVDGSNAYNGRYRNSFPFNALLQDQVSRGGGFYTVGNDEPEAETKSRQWQIINTTTWNASDTLTVKNIASYAQLQNDLMEDLYGGDMRMPSSLQLQPPSQQLPNGFALPVAAGDVGLGVYGIGSAPPPGMHTIDQSTLSEELQFQGMADEGRLIWQAGGYFETSRALNPNGSMSRQFIHCDNWAALDCYDVLGKYISQLQGRQTPTGSLGYQVGELDYTNYGIYTQSTYSLTDELKLTGGIRYTYDEMKGEAINGRWLFTGANFDTPSFYCSNSSTGQPTSYRDQNGNVNAPVGDINDCRVSYKKNSDAVTWVLGLDYKPSDAVMLYGKWSRGYRQGGVTPVSAQSATTYGPEQVDTYEVGVKTNFRAPIRGTFNVAAFYNDFRDQQLSIGFQDSTNSVPPNVGIVNAGQSRIYGAEVETVLIPVQGLNVSLSYAYINSRVEKVDVVPPSPPFDIVLPIAQEGDSMPFTPEHKLSASVFYTLPLDSKVGEVSFGPTYTYQSTYLVDASANRALDRTGQPAPSSYGEIGGRALVNFNLNWNAVYGGPVDLGLFVTNVTGKEYYTNTTNGLIRFGYEAAYLGEPRMYGARIRINFGG